MESMSVLSRCYLRLCIGAMLSTCRCPKLHYSRWALGPKTEWRFEGKADLSVV